MGTIQVEDGGKGDLDDSGCVQDATFPIKSEPEPEPGPGTAQLLDLSDDVLLYILRLCTPRDLKALGFSCSRLASLILERSLWKNVDARNEPCGKFRFKWLLYNALHADTRSLMITGFAKQAHGCLGYEKEVRSGHGKGSETMGEDGPSMEVPYAGRRLRFKCVNDPPLSRYGVLKWPFSTPDERYEMLAEQPHCDAAGLCYGPRFTADAQALALLASACPALAELALEYCNFDCKAVSIAHFPSTLKRLSLRGSNCYNAPVDKSFLYRIQEFLPQLEDIDVSECDWLEPSSLLPLSKLSVLRRLKARDAPRLTEFVAYASLSTRYGFRSLEEIDLRGCPVGDSEVSALGWLPCLRVLRLQAHSQGKNPVVNHRHANVVPTKREVLLDYWETNGPDTFKYSSGQQPEPKDCDKPIVMVDDSSDEEDVRKGDPDKDKSRVKRKSLAAEDQPSTSKKKKYEEDSEEGPNLCICGRSLPEDKSEDPEPGEGSKVINESVESDIEDEEDELDDGPESKGHTTKRKNNSVRLGREKEADGAKEEKQEEPGPSGSKKSQSGSGRDGLRSRRRKEEPGTTQDPVPGTSGIGKGKRKPERRGKSGDDNQEDNEGPSRRVLRSQTRRDEANVDTSPGSSGTSPNDMPGPSGTNTKGKGKKKSQGEGSGKQNDDFAVIEPEVRVRVKTYRWVRKIEKGQEGEASKEQEDRVRKGRDSNLVVTRYYCDDETEKEKEKQKADGDNRAPPPPEENDSDSSDDSQGGGRHEGVCISVIRRSGNFSLRLNNGKRVHVSPLHVGPVREEVGPEGDDGGRVRGFICFRRGNHPEREAAALADDAQYRALYLNFGQPHQVMYGYGHPMSFVTDRFGVAGGPLPDNTLLVSDASIRRFGRADGERINYVIVGPVGPDPDRFTRPDRSPLEELSVQGYGDVTDRSLAHLATAAPRLRRLDVRGTGATEQGVERFRALRPECEVLFGEMPGPGTEPDP